MVVTAVEMQAELFAQNDPGDADLALRPDVGVGVHVWTQTPAGVDDPGSGMVLLGEDGNMHRELALVILPDQRAFSILSSAPQIPSSRGPVWAELLGNGNGINTAANMTALIEQRVVIAHRETAPRAMRRGLAGDYVLDDTAVYALTWRRATVIVDGKPTELTGRANALHWVGGHFQNYHVGPREGGSLRRRYRESHIRGRAPARPTRPTLNRVVR